MQMWFGEKLWAISGENGSKGSVPRHTDTQAELECSPVKKQEQIQRKEAQKAFHQGCNNLFLAFHILV